jgi:C-terminal processing protease CtpA/Prc
VRFSKTSFQKPGDFHCTQSLTFGEKNKKYYKGKIIVLIAETTQSHAEYSTMMLQTIPKTITIGSKTAGADGNISYLNLPGGIRAVYSGIGIYYPDGRETQRVGIIPDIEVKPTIQGIREGRDEILEKAIEVINQK